MDYWDAIDYLLALPDLERFSSGPPGQTMSLEAMKALLKRLDSPQNGRRTIHVTGSKGKGSTSQIIASVLNERGFQTALFTSPHLHDYVERLNFNLLPVSRFDFADGVGEIRDAIEEVNTSELGPVSTFGALTALFFHLCRKFKVQWQVVEVGMGGLHDATNVFSSKEAAVITAISLEHTAILGETCEAIATEKSGIITPRCVTICGAQRSAGAREVIRSQAEKQNSEFVDVASLYKVHPKSHDSNGQSFVVEGPNRKYDLHTMLLGIHQLDNIATSAATIEAVMGTMDEDAWALEDGVGNVELPGRLEQLTRHPLTVIDGAHNEESMQALVAALDRHFDYDECFFVLGAHSDKNIAAMLDAIKPMKPKGVVVTRSTSRKAMAPETIAQHARERGFETHVSSDVEQALNIIRSLAGRDDLVCITGSLYVVAEARQSILSLPVMH